MQAVVPASSGHACLLGMLAASNRSANELDCRAVRSPRPATAAELSLTSVAVSADLLIRYWKLCQAQLHSALRLWPIPALLARRLLRSAQRGHGVTRETETRMLRAL